MSFMDEYNALKKKKDKWGGAIAPTPVTSTVSSSNSSSSFMDEYNALKGKETSIDMSNFGTVGSLSMDASPSEVLKRSNALSLTIPTRAEEDKWFKGWVQSGALGSGVNAENVSKTLLGTTADTTDDFLTGFLGAPEAILDKFVTLAPYAELGQYYANGMGGFNPQLDQMHMERAEEIKKVAAEWASKELYDASALSKGILSRLAGASYLSNIVQSGGQVTEEDMALANEMQKVSVDYIENQMESDSVVGEKLDSTVQAMGRNTFTKALSVLGVPWFVTSYATASGSEIENALNQGATLDEAVLSGAITGGGEVLTEMLSGGINFGSHTLDEMLTSRLATSISNKYVRTALKLGMDVFGEGAEEWLSEDIGRFGQWLTYRDDEELVDLLWSEEAMQSKIEAFISGGIMGGVSGTIGAVDAKHNGVDYTTGMTNEEQRVVESLVNKRVETESENGKVSASRKAKIYEDISALMEKGYISAEDIESVLGGDEYTKFATAKDNFFGSDDYKAYQQAVKAEEEAKAEFEPLVKMKNGEMTGEQTYRRDELKKFLDESKSKELHSKLSPEASRVIALRNQMRKNVSRMVQGSRLAESYNELARKQQKFEVDLNQYTNENARKTVQAILDSGLGDNSNKFHDTVEFLAKLSADKGVVFDLTNNEKLKGTEHHKEGYWTHGFVSDDGNIVLNMDSPRALNTTVGHEITHVLEKAGIYGDLQKAVFNYAISKEGQAKFDARLAEAREIYKDKKNTTAEGEVTADIIGEYLFTDYEFISNLSTTNRNVFQKIYDEIKYMVKVATAGSNEARELLKAKKMFDKAYRENVKGKPVAENATTAEGGGKKYSLKVKDKKGNVSIADPYATTREQSREFMVKSRKGELDQYTYFPVSAHTPGTIIATLNDAGIEISDKPLAMQAKKARQSQIDGQHTEQDGTVIRHHAMSTDEIQETIDKLNDPFAVIHQTNRKKTVREDGKNIRVPAPDNFVFFVTLDSGKECVAVIEFDSIINKDMIQKDGHGDEYHTTVTVFEPDQYRDGEPFDYLEYLAIKPSNYELDIIKESPKTETAISQTEATVSESELSSKILPQDEPVVNPDSITEEAEVTETDDVQYSMSVKDEETLDFLNEQIERGEFDQETNPDGGYYVTYKSMSFWGYDEEGNAILRSPMAEYVDGELSNAYLVPKDKSKLNWYKSTETIDEKTGLPSGLLVGIREEGKKSKKYVPAAENQDLIADDWSNLYFMLNKKVLKDGKWKNSPVPARYNPYEHSSNSMLNDQFKAAWQRDNLVTVKMYVPRSEDNGAFRAQWSKDPTGWSDWKSGDVATKINKQKDLQRRVYLSRYAAPVEIVPDSEVAQAYKGYLEGTDVAIPDNVVSPNLLKELKKAGVPIVESGKVQYSMSEITEEQNEQGLDRASETQYSLSKDTEFSNNAIKKNQEKLLVDAEAMTAAKELRERIASRMNDIKDRGLVALPEDMEGNTYIANSSYDGTEENTTICPRSLASEAFVDAVSEYLGRPLTVEEQIYISQDLQGRSLTPECTYCYVATDRKAYRAFLGEYINQRDAVIEKIKANPNADVSKSGDLYREFLNGRKDTKPMYNRFKMWVDAYQNGTPMVEASHLANISKLMGDIKEFGEDLKPQIVDAMKYAQSASWAKKRVSYVAYNGHILKWKEDRIKKLNSHYGLRMYSFSDFHPAFVLENMQMITDASVRGLKMLGYTKDTDFVEIFAPSGMNINISTFGFETDGNVYENNIIGAEWAKAQELRSQYPNVGITFVATNDTLVEWALDQDWIDVVIPYHLVRTGAEVAKAFGYTNYTSESSDTKTSEWKKGDKKSIAPTEHNNDFQTYMDALAKNHLNPRFERFKDNPNYMKLVNECRQSASQSKPVQPVFNEDAAMVALAKLEANGYYQPIGGSVDRMYEIAAEVAEDMTQSIAPTKYSQSKIINTLTGEEIDGNTYRVLEWLNNGEDVTPDEISSLKEVQEGKIKTGEMLDNFIADNPELKSVPKHEVGTYLLSSEERKSVRDRVISERLQEGSFSGFDKNGKEEYNGSVQKGKRLDIVIGLPASGKSSSIVNPLSEFYHSAVIDSDIIKGRLPEYDDGWGSMLVHEESSMMNIDLLDASMEMGNNIVLPIVGSKVSSVEKYIDQAKDYGYNIHIHLNELPNGKAVGRMLKRYFDDGRFIDPSFALAYGNKPTEVYEQIKQRSDISGYSRWDNDVAKGQRPVPREASENNRLYEQYSGAWGQSGRAETRRIEGKETSGETQTDQIAPIRQTSSDDGVFFDAQNPQYSMTRASELENAYQHNLDNDDLFGAEMVVEEMANIAMPDSKIRGKDGRLIPVYHGTREMFWEFDTSVDGGKNGTAEGYGIYTSDDPEVTEVYGERQMKMFANITKPATSSKKTVTASTLAKLIKDTCQRQAERMVADGEYDSVKEALFDTWVSNYTYTYDIGMDRAYREVANSILRMNESDMDVVQEVMSGMGIRDYGEAMQFYRNSLIPITGFDGFATTWHNSSTGTTSNIYLAFDSSQLKSADAVNYDDNGDVIPLSERFNPDKKDIRYSMSKEGAKQSIHGDYHVYGSDFGLDDPLADFAPVAISEMENTTRGQRMNAPTSASVSEKERVADGIQIRTVKERLNAKLTNRQTELANIEKHRADSLKSLDEKIAKAQATLDGKKNKDTKVANALKKRIERLQRLKADIDAGYAKRINDIKKSIDKTSVELEKDHTERDRYERAVARINAMLKHETEALNAEYAQKKADLQSRLANKDSYISNTARELYDELRGLRKGVRASEKLASLLDGGFDWGNLRSALSNVRYTPNQTVNPNSVAERAVRQLLNESYESDMESINDLDVELAEKVHQLEVKAEEDRKNARTANQRKLKMEEHSQFWSDLIGNTSTWKDLPWGLAYKTRTLRRILRKVVRDANGNVDIAKADAIYDALETKYDHNEALLKKESQRLKEVFFKLKLTHEEDAYAQMLGELRHNPDTTLTEDVVRDYYNQHKGKIDTNKVDRAIAETRRTYDELFDRLNAALREQGMKEIPYRQGYFPHFTNPKQNWFEKLMNWKHIDTEIPTSIAGLTDQFKPQRSWQSFNKQRMGDKTDYSLYQGLDTYIHGALDWIYHIDDLQSRRALENHLRYTHSDEGIKARIEEIKANDTYDADEAQKMIDGVLAEANNPLGGLVRELMNRTNTLANKKSSMDRGMEDFTNRKIYSTLTNLNNRITANQVVGSLSSALTNFIPMVQSWHQVSPFYTVRGLGDMIRSTVQDDGLVAKSDFLTNRLIEEEKLYKTGWDKVTDKAAFMMNVVDNITSQTVWRSKYLQNLHEGMSEAQAIRDADQFSKNLMAGRSRGNAPTIFDAKNPIVKIFTAFQLEVANQYGYMFEDVPQDTESKARLVKGYAAAFLGAYMYNALYSSLVGRDAAFDPISILEDLLKDLFGDDEEEPEEIIMNLADNILEEVPYIGGLLGGGRIPMSSALPYGTDSTPFESMLTDVSEGNLKSLGKQLLKPLYYLAMPVAGGQIKKTMEGLGMFLGDQPVTGSYTDSGKLRFPVEATFGNVLQAGLFGQYASQNAREYFDEGRSPLGENQIEEFMASGLPIHDYWEYREGLSGLSKLDEKADYIAGLDLPIDTKNLFINNIADRGEDIDLTGYDAFGDFEEFDFAVKYPEKYEIAQAVGGYEAYMTYQEGMKDMNLAEKVDYVAGLDLTVEQKNALINGETDRKDPIDLTGYENFSSFEEFEYAQKNPAQYAVSQAVGGYDAFVSYTDALGDIHADKDEYGQSISGSRKEKVSAYIYSLDIPEIQQHILFKMEYNSDDEHNEEIIEYLNHRKDISAEEMTAILLQLGFLVDSEGNIYW